jgi:hypothetical protein
MPDADLAADDISRRCAYHEAAHAIMNLVVGMSVSVSIFDDGSGTVTPTGRHLDPFDRACCDLAGPIAEARYAGISVEQMFAEGDICAGDRENAERALDKLREPPTFDEAVEITRQAVDNVWHQIEAVAAALMERGTLELDELLKLCGHTHSSWGDLRWELVPIGFYVDRLKPKSD